MSAQLCLDLDKTGPGPPKTKPLAVSRGGNDFVCNEFVRVQ